ncbi:hypothetical protein [Sinorhizobium meliloti]|uniref:hypothetical protein n=1 Tax=Rhizobium meliloti TaxID=382 RepID=UPI000B499C8C|nr:hypothetical protein [Sinorhizobium meliloti]ASP92488.1 hypothetical protein CDO25_15850 [Sinorhizobium meliloti]MQX56172.1 hypothetical protein [Sinorhizobium meliloti]RVO90591.1 hypothetical protein CN088_05575 [Sinorhizobium meliloti]RVQ14186.1 hypothetical protein CN063_13855 [Sinorhizobium meliloti]
MQDNSVLRIEFKNTKPIELVDLTTSFTALAESFKDFANSTTGDPHPNNLRLYVKEIRSGSVIADLITVAEQAQWIMEHAEVFAGFVSSTNELVNYFLGRESAKAAEPSVKQARQIAQFVEPVAKDFGSQLNMNVMDGAVVHVHQHFHINGMEANAVQNGVNRFLGPRLPSTQVLPDQLMILEQVKNSASAKSGDRGIIEAVYPKPVRLQFSSEEAKRRVLDLQENPLQCVFQVNVEVRSIEGRPALYRIIEVTDVIHRETE